MSKWKTITINVEMCRDCPWMQRNIFGSQECGQMHIEENNTFEEIEYVDIIPDWCPFPDYSGG